MFITKKRYNSLLKDITDYKDIASKALQNNDEAIKTAKEILDYSVKLTAENKSLKNMLATYQAAETTIGTILQSYNDDMGEYGTTGEDI